jgi:hypothetical protein
MDDNSRVRPSSIDPSVSGCPSPKVAKRCLDKLAQEQCLTHTDALPRGYAEDGAVCCTCFHLSALLLHGVIIDAIVGHLERHDIEVLRRVNTTIMKAIDGRVPRRFYIHIDKLAASIDNVRHCDAGHIGCWTECRCNRIDLSAVHTIAIRALHDGKWSYSARITRRATAKNQTFAETRCLEQTLVAMRDIIAPCRCLEFVGINFSQYAPFGMSYGTQVHMPPLSVDRITFDRCMFSQWYCRFVKARFIAVANKQRKRPLSYMLRSLIFLIIFWLSGVYLQTQHPRLMASQLKLQPCSRVSSWLPPQPPRY